MPSTRLPRLEGDRRKNPKAWLAADDDDGGGGGGGSESAAGVVDDNNFLFMFSSSVCFNMKVEKQDDDATNPLAEDDGDVDDDGRCSCSNSVSFFRQIH